MGRGGWRQLILSRRAGYEELKGSTSALGMRCNLEAVCAFVSVLSSPLRIDVVMAEHLLMVGAGDVSSGRRVRMWRSAAEKRQIVQWTLELGAAWRKQCGHTV